MNAIIGQGKSGMALIRESVPAQCFIQPLRTAKERGGFLPTANAPVVFVFGITAAVADGEALDSRVDKTDSSLLLLLLLLLLGWGRNDNVGRRRRHGGDGGGRGSGDGGRERRRGGFFDDLWHLGAIGAGATFGGCEDACAQVLFWSVCVDVGVCVCM